MQNKKESYKRSRLSVLVFSTEDIMTASKTYFEDGVTGTGDGENGLPIYHSTPAPVGAGPRDTH